VKPCIASLLVVTRNLPTELRKKLEGEWTGISEFRKHAEELANALQEQISQTATSLGCDVVTVLKNLVAETPVRNLPRIWALLVFWAPRLETKVSEEAIQLVRLIEGMLQTKHDFFGWALVGGRAPSLARAIEFFAGDLAIILAYHRDVLRNGTPTTAEQTANLIGLLARKKIVVCTQQNMEILLEEFHNGLQPLDQKNFEKLPKSIRCWFLRENEFRAAAIAASFLSQIRANPFEFPDTPQALDYKNLHEVILPFALRDFSLRNLNSFHIQILLRRAELESFSGKILNAIRRPKNSKVGRTSQAVLCLPTKLAIKSEKNLKTALTFLSKPLNSRIEWMMGCSRPDVLELARNLPKEDLQNALKACASRPALMKYRKIFATFSRHELPRLLHSKTASREFLETFSPDIFTIGDTAEMLSLFDAKANCLAEVSASLLHCREFQRFVLECASNSSRFALFLKNAPRLLLEHLLNGKSPIFGNFQSAVSLTLSASRTRALRQNLRKSMIELAPNFIGNFLGWEIEKPEFSELVGIRMKSKSKAPATAFSHFVFKNGKPAWEFFLDDRKCRRFLKPLIRAHRPDLIQRMDQLQAESLLRSSEFRDKLLAHLCNTIHAPLAISTGVRWELIPWIREKFENKPTLSIAYQLALAFSINDARYLRKLCFERWASPLRETPGHVFNHLYSLHRIPKKSGGFREIHAPCAELKKLQNRILKNGFDHVPMSRSAHGFHCKRSILTNATPHSGKACVVNVDIDSFFQTTGHNLIFQATAHLANRHLSYGARHALADILSHNGVLPTGAPTSPAIGNLVLRGADAAIAKAASRNGIDYTRYADDLTFSGHRHTVKILPFVEKVLGQLGYKLNSKKTNIYRRGRRQMVTGLVVNEKPNLPRGALKKLRAAVHAAANGKVPHWNGQPINKNQLAGRIALLNLVNQEKAAKLKAKLGANHF
jgi:RNA-directed DNA polymerase